MKLPKSLSRILRCARLLRRPAPQRQGGVPVLHGRLRRQSGQPEPLPPQESAKRYLELLGGADRPWLPHRLLFDVGDYRWAAELLNHAVFGDPSAKSAKGCWPHLRADGLPGRSRHLAQLYLTAAQELRNGPPTKGVSKAMMIEMLLQTPWSASWKPWPPA